MKKRKMLLTGILAVTILSSLLVMSGCGAEEESQNSKTSSTDSNSVDTIKETKLENYKVNVTNSFINHTSSAGLALKFEVTFDDISPAYEAYVYNDRSSLYDEKINEENQKKFEELKEEYPDVPQDELVANDEYSSLWYTSIFAENLTYASGKSVEIEWAPYPTENNASKYSSEEEYLKTGYMYLVLKEEENIIGFMVFEFPISTNEEDNSVTYKEINVLEAVAFEKTDGKYQNVSLDYVKSRVDSILETKE